jgi:hypothetical protein
MSPGSRGRATAEVIIQALVRWRRSAAAVARLCHGRMVNVSAYMTWIIQRAAAADAPSVVQAANLPAIAPGARLVLTKRVEFEPLCQGLLLTLRLSQWKQRFAPSVVWLPDIIPLQSEVSSKPEQQRLPSVDSVFSVVARIYWCLATPVAYVQHHPPNPHQHHHHHHHHQPGPPRGLEAPSLVPTSNPENALSSSKPNSPSSPHL